jgi:hypothetical protein
MSEYQYYEFLALDRPLEQSEIAALRAISSRADISATRFTNVYNFGDFKGSPDKLMEKYFDAHVYVANWGTHTLILRIPRGSVDEKFVEQYVVSHACKFWTTKEHLIIQWERSSEDEPPDEWVDGEGWMARLIAIREELERGDYRALYLGWLYGMQWSLPVDTSEEDIDDEYEIAGGVKLDAIEPPVPAGLSALTAAQRALVEFLEINPDLLAAAAGASADASAPTDSTQDIEQWVTRLSADEARPYLLLLVQGKARQAEAQIRRAYTASLRSSSSTTTTSQRRSVADIRQLIGEARAERREREAKQKKRELEKKRQERERYLTTVAADAERHWKKVNELVAQQTASAYDQVRDLLVDLSEAAILAQKRDNFVQRFSQFRTTHGRRPALMKRLEQAKLIV